VRKVLRLVFRTQPRSALFQTPGGGGGTAHGFGTEFFGLHGFT